MRSEHSPYARTGRRASHSVRFRRTPGLQAGPAGSSSRAVSLPKATGMQQRARHLQRTAGRETNGCRRRSRALPKTRPAGRAARTLLLSDPARQKGFATLNPAGSLDRRARAGRVCAGRMHAGRKCAIHRCRNRWMSRPDRTLVGRHSMNRQELRPKNWRRDVRIPIQAMTLASEWPGRSKLLPARVVDRAQPLWESAQPRSAARRKTAQGAPFALNLPSAKRLQVSRCAHPQAPARPRCLGALPARRGRSRLPAMAVPTVARPSMGWPARCGNSQSMPMSRARAAQVRRARRRGLRFVSRMLAAQCCAVRPSQPGLRNRMFAPADLPLPS